MLKRPFSALKSAKRLRQIAVDEAQKGLSDAHRVREASELAFEALEREAASLEARERAILAAAGGINLESLCVARRYRAWLAQELNAARAALERAELIETQARVRLESCIRARDAAGRLLERRELEARTNELRFTQNQLDDQGALRVVSSLRLIEN